jgi:hypothetical protein
MFENFVNFFGMQKSASARRAGPVNDPAAVAFEIFVGDQKVGQLFEPKREEMFWCSYRVESTDEQADKILRDEKVWSEVNFKVKAKNGRIVSTFTGGDYVAFCNRKTDRLSFRSLWPIDS